MTNSTEKRGCFGTRECKVHSIICIGCPWFKKCMAISVKKKYDFRKYSKGYESRLERGYYSDRKKLTSKGDTL